ncbi:MAG: hypothetical protein OCD76_07330 [Reichenbachiella sp.]
MPSKLQLKAKAKVAVRKRKEAQEASHKALIEQLLSMVSIPTPEKGKDGRDAPELSEILTAITPLLPETKVEQTTVEKTIVQKIDSGELEGLMDAMLEAKLPEMDKDLRPKVELIREEISDEQLEGLVTQRDLDKALRKVQDAITYHSGTGGGAPEVGPITNILLANQAENIFEESDLDNTKINIVHATVSDSTVQLPMASPNYIVWVEDAVLGGGNITISREA